GSSPGVVACDKGYETPLGTSELDNAFLDALKANLGAQNADKLLAHRYDHEREHSVELHIPWIQHVFRDSENGTFPKVLGILIHNPLHNSGRAYSEEGLDL